MVRTTLVGFSADGELRENSAALSWSCVRCVV